MIVTEELSHDMIHYDMSMHEIKRIPGVEISESLLPSLKKIISDRRIVQPAANNKLLWLSSVHTLSIVDTHTFKPTEIKNFWTYSGQKCIGIFATATSDLKRFAGIGLSPEGVETLHVYDMAGGTGFASASISKLFKSNLNIT
jgi:hypothetical protein